jgi:hypothetical protein
VLAVIVRIVPGVLMLAGPRLHAGVAALAGLMTSSAGLASARDRSGAPRRRLVETPMDLSCRAVPSLCQLTVSVIADRSDQLIFIKPLIRRKIQ